ncbi:T3SS effector cysteine hydrolase SpvD family protein [Arsenophonus endosymbiont of Aleurodicus floccissimus]|nr:T3SS effector cysteine hydrolase SpvD family protein [Arsenophonus endosymbiont of Aleurodicus floccissimus]
MVSDFNAVVLCGEDNKPYVQFVDSWKTSMYYQPLQN